MSRRRVAVKIGAVALVAGALGVGVAVAANRTHSSNDSAALGTTGQSSYTYYQSMMRGFGTGSMMGGTSGWMMGTAGYRWMMGGVNAPNWMRGEKLPAFMMGASSDPGKVMGKLFADAPGPRVSPADATRLGNEVLAGATVDAARNRITFSGSAAQFAVLASPADGLDETFRLAGLMSPTIVVRAGSRVTIEVVNADPDTAHGLVVTASGSASSWMPMMTAAPVLSGSAVWFLGNPTSAGMHAATLRFTAATPGTYQYLCPVPGHARKGMVGTFVVAR
jgi:rusticyanin